MLDVRRLRLLRELARRGTLAAVAEALSYSPSAVSQQLTRLQEEAGVPLLQPSGRGVVLTPAAELLVEHADAVLTRLERAEADLAAAGDRVAGTLQLGTYQSVAHALLPAALDLLDRRHPRLRVEAWVLEPADSIPALLTEDLDVAVDEEYPGHPAAPDDRLHREVVQHDRLRLVVPAAWDVGHELADLADRPWVFEPRGTVARDWSVAFCREAGFEPVVRFAFNDLVLRLRFASTGHAATILPALAAADDDPGVRVHDLPGAPARRISTLVRRGSVGHPAIRALRAALRDAAGETGEAPDAGAA